MAHQITRTMLLAFSVGLTSCMTQWSTTERGMVDVVDADGRAWLVVVEKGSNVTSVQCTRAPAMASLESDTRMAADKQKSCAPIAGLPITKKSIADLKALLRTELTEYFESENAHRLARNLPPHLDRESGRPAGVNSSGSLDARVDELRRTLRAMPPGSASTEAQRFADQIRFGESVVRRGLSRESRLAGVELMTDGLAHLMDLLGEGGQKDVLSASDERSDRRILYWLARNYVVPPSSIANTRFEQLYHYSHNQLRFFEGEDDVCVGTPEGVFCTDPDRAGKERTIRFTRHTANQFSLDIIGERYKGKLNFRQLDRDRICYLGDNSGGSCDDPRSIFARVN